MIKSIFFCLVAWLLGFRQAAEAQNTVDLTLIPDRQIVSEQAPSLKFVLLVKNSSQEKISILDSKYVVVGNDPVVCWNFIAVYEETPKWIFRMDEPSWKDLRSYRTLKPNETCCFQFDIDFTMLEDDSVFMKSANPDDLVSLGETLWKRNTDFGKYEFFLEYNDPRQKRRNAVSRLQSNHVQIEYIKF